MKIGITGVTGLIGRCVAALARSRGHEIVGFTRRAGKPMPDCVEIRLLAETHPPNLQGCDAILNLAGENIMGLWTESKRRAIRESRVHGTRQLVEAIAKMPAPPRALVSGSAIGYYGEAGEAELTEAAGPGDGFLAKVCRDWEGEARQAAEYGVRAVTLRTGIVLARESGALAAMLPAFRLGLGGRLGSGRQWVSWIHLEDEAALAVWALENAMVSGPLNATAPSPVRNEELTRTLAKQLHRPAFFAVPAFAIRLATGQLSEELLGSRCVLPAAAQAGGFVFQFPTLSAALENLLK